MVHQAPRFSALGPDRVFASKKPPRTHKIAPPPSQAAMGQQVAAPIACGNPQTGPGGLKREAQPEDPRRPRQLSVDCSCISALYGASLLVLQLRFGLLYSTSKGFNLLESRWIKILFLLEPFYHSFGFFI